MLKFLTQSLKDLIVIFGPIEQYLIVFLDIHTNFPWCEVYTVIVWVQIISAYYFYKWIWSIV